MFISIHYDQTDERILKFHQLMTFYSHTSSDQLVQILRKRVQLYYQTIRISTDFRQKSAIILSNRVQNDVR